jgi:hypothetical protein
MEVRISEKATCFGEDAHPPKKREVSRRTDREKWKRIGKWLQAVETFTERRPGGKS